MSEFQELDWRFEFNDRGTHSGNYLDKLNQLVLGFNTTIRAYNAQLLAETDAQAQQALAEQFRNDALTFRNQAEAVALGDIQGTNLNLASCKVGGVDVALTNGLIANATNAESANNSDKLNNQLPAYYAKQSDVTALNQIVFSDDTALNEIQEIVDYIKLNRSDLDALSIDSIAGLLAALAGKSSTSHNHDSAYLGKSESARSLASTRLNYEGVTNDNVVGQLGWSNYGNSHTIFDASKGVTPAGTACDKSNPYSPWTANFPTLMGFDGAYTFGVRVDSAKKSDLSVDSTKLSNLALHGGRNKESNKVVRTDENGYLQTGYINTDTPTDARGAANYFFDLGDGYIRKKTLAQVKAEINTDTWRGISNSVSSASQTTSASSYAVRAAYNLANHSHPYAASSHSHSGYVNTAVKSSSGYWKCRTTGLIIQWGTGSIAAGNTTKSQNFPTAFPSTCVAVSITIRETGTNDHNPVYVYSRSRTSIVSRNTQA